MPEDLPEQPEPELPAGTPPGRRGPKRIPFRGRLAQPSTEYRSAFGKWLARGEAVVWCTVEGFFWFPRTLMSFEKLMFAFADQPELRLPFTSDPTALQSALLFARELCPSYASRYTGRSATTPSTNFLSGKPPLPKML